MKKIFILSFFWITCVAHADTIISDPINENTVWSQENGVYIINSSFTVARDATLTIQPGTIIKIKTNGTGGPSIFGNLIAKGTADKPIYFTSYNDDGVGGDTGNDGETTGSKNDWQGLYFKSGSSGDFEHVVVSYAGYGGFGYGDYVGIENDGGSLQIKQSYIHDNGTFGIYNKSGNLTLDESIVENHIININIEKGKSELKANQIKNASLFGLLSSSVDSLVIENTAFSGNKKTAQINAKSGLVHDGNTSNDITERGFQLVGEVKDGYHLHSNDLPILLTQGSLFISPNTTVYVDEGTVFKLGWPASAIDVFGTLDVLGTENAKVYFTSIKDDSVGGDTNADGAGSIPSKKDWQGIVFEQGSRGNLNNAVVRYAGESIGKPGVWAAIYNLGGDLKIENSSIDHNYSDGIYQSDGSLVAEKLELTDQSTGLKVLGGDASIHHSKFLRNISMGIENDNTKEIDATNNWWGSRFGPQSLENSTSTGDRINSNVLYAPWTGRDPALPNPVIIIPGIMGSYLVDDLNSEVWPDLNLMAIPGSDTYLNKLILNTDGSENMNIFPSAIIKSLSGTNLFKGLFENLTNFEVYENFYDWRLDISQSSKDLKKKIDLIKIESGSDKVTLVAHSMGGLLVKKYIKDYGGSSVDKFIDIGTPHLGAPKTFKALSYGDNFGFETFRINILDPNRARVIIQNMPSVYELLPSKNYFNNSDINYKYYIFNGVNKSDRLNFDQTNAYLKFEGRNSALIDNADSFHKEIDDLNPSDYGVKTFNLVGCGTPTMGQIFILDKKSDDYSYNIKMINGDGTVPIRSAEGIPALKTYYIKGVQHATMPSMSGVKELVVSILMTSGNPDVTSLPNVLNSKTNCKIPNGKLVSFHSPINLNVFDTLGNHSGPNSDGDIENNIPGVDYEVIGDNKFAYLPGGMEYTIKGDATDSGTFDVRVETIEDEEVTNTTLFNDIPLTPLTKTEFKINQNPLIQIPLDQDGDGIFESSFDISTTTDGFMDSTGKVIKNDSPISIVAASAVASIGGHRKNLVSPLNASLDQKPPLVIQNDTILPQILKKPFRQIKISTPIFASEPIQPALIGEGNKKDVNAQNTAVVYKSLGLTIINILKNVWAWFKSLL